MGLTIHYSLHSTTKAASRAVHLVHQMRQLALDLPLEHVGEVQVLEADQCDPDGPAAEADEGLRWLLIQSQQFVDFPWSDRHQLAISPARIIAFETWPGPGCEAANFGLCLYPSIIEQTYRPTDDGRFHEEYQPAGPGSTAWRFDWSKWDRWLKRSGHSLRLSPHDERFVDVRKVKTGFSGWRWSSFCKTQYASGNGMANFLRCHISVITLLDRIATLPSLSVEIDDEGKYGPSKYSDDWREARAERREPTYTWHPGTYDPKALAAEVGEWNEMIAAFAGGLKDSAWSGQFEAPITQFTNFEHLEFKGSQDERLGPFLAALKKLTGVSQACDSSGGDQKC